MLQNPNFKESMRAASAQTALLDSFYVQKDILYILPSRISIAYLVLDVQFRLSNSKFNYILESSQTTSPVSPYIRAAIYAHEFLYAVRPYVSGILEVPDAEWGELFPSPLSRRGSSYGHQNLSAT